VNSFVFTLQCAKIICSKNTFYVADILPGVCAFIFVSRFGGQKTLNTTVPEKGWTTKNSRENNLRGITLLPMGLSDKRVAQIYKNGRDTEKTPGFPVGECITVQPSFRMRVVHVCM